MNFNYQEIVNSNRISVISPEDSSLWYQIILFLLWPLLSLIVALCNYKRPESRHIVTLYCGFIGMMIMVGDTADGVRYREQFLYYSQINFSDMLAILNSFIFEQEQADISREVIFFLIGRFTNEPLWMWTTLGVIFGYIYSKNIWFLIRESNINKSFNVNSIIFFVALFFIITPTQGINQFRFWLAAHIFFYGAMQIVMFKNPRYFFVTFLASLVHFGLILPNLAVVIFYFLGRRDSIYIPLAIISVAFAEIELQILSGYVEILGPAVEDRFEGYTSDRAFDRAEDLQERSWFMVWWQPLLLYMTYVMLIYVYVKLKKDLGEQHLNILSFLIILVAIFNIVSHFPMIYRYLPLLYLFVFAFLYLVYSHLTTKTFDLILIPCIIPILLMIVVQTRIMFGFVDVSVLIFNPIFRILGRLDITILDFLL